MDVISGKVKGAVCVGAETVLGYNRSDANPAPLGSVAQLVKGRGVGCFLTTCNCQQATLLKLARKKNELSRAIGRFARSLVHGRYRVDTCAYPKLMSTANLVPTVHVIGFRPWIITASQVGYLGHASGTLPDTRQNFGVCTIFLGCGGIVALGSPITTK